jgi:hypothetical protein
MDELPRLLTHGGTWMVVRGHGGSLLTPPFLALGSSCIWLLSEIIVTLFIINRCLHLECPQWHLCYWLGPQSMVHSVSGGN